MMLLLTKNWCFFYEIYQKYRYRYQLLTEIYELPNRNIVFDQFEKKKWVTEMNLWYEPMCRSDFFFLTKYFYSICSDIYVSIAETLKLEHV